MHGAYVRDRRINVLCRHLLEALPAVATVLDVGCGDGRLASSLAKARPHLQVLGIDVLERPDTAIPVRVFDGRRIPYEDGTFDAVILVDVLHHTDEPDRLLREAARVSVRHVVIKDHLREGLLARATLAFMDRTGNLQHGVASPGTYWKRSQWLEAFSELPFSLAVWNEGLGLYPPPASLLFDRRLHFVARLDRDGGASPTSPQAALANRSNLA